jgi:hypothetical protein
MKQIDIELNKMYTLNLDKKGTMVTVKVIKISYAKDVVTFVFGHKHAHCSMSHFKAQMHFGQVIVVDFINKRRVVIAA